MSIKGLYKTAIRNLTKVKGYKAMNVDMTCRGYQFEIGKTFHHKGKINPCVSGFHFCEKLEDVFMYYTQNCRVFEVIGYGDVLRKNDKVACSDIEIVREVDYQQLTESDNKDARACAIYNGKIHSWYQNDVWDVVIAAIKNGHHDVSLATHENVWVRYAMAEYGHNLDILVNDTNPLVRKVIAKQSYALDKLINDNESDIRIIVANQGYGLDKLVLDQSSNVRNAAMHQINNTENFSIRGYKATNNDMTCIGYQFEVGGKFHHDGDVIPCKSGFHFCTSIDDIFGYYSTDCRIFEVIGSGTLKSHTNKIVCSDIEFVREIDYAEHIGDCNMFDLYLARHGMCLSKLKNHKYGLVRRTVDEKLKEQRTRVKKVRKDKPTEVVKS